jgi:hypothetical protein
MQTSGPSPPAGAHPGGMPERPKESVREWRWSGLAPRWGAGSAALTGGLRCAATSGYRLSALRAVAPQYHVATVFSSKAANVKSPHNDRAPTFGAEFDPGYIIEGFP